MQARILVIDFAFNLNSEIGTAGFADFTDFEEAFGMSVRIFSWQNFRALIIVTCCIYVICVICG